MLLTPCTLLRDPCAAAGSVTAFYHVLAARHLSEIAAALGKATDAATWRGRFAKGKAAFHARYYSAAAGGYSPCVEGPSHCYGTSANGSQVGRVMPE